MDWIIHCWLRYYRWKHHLWAIFNHSLIRCLWYLLQIERWHHPSKLHSKVYPRGWPNSKGQRSDGLPGLLYSSRKNLQRLRRPKRPRQRLWVLDPPRRQTHDLKQLLHGPIGYLHQKEIRRYVFQWRGLRPSRFQKTLRVHGLRLQLRLRLCQEQGWTVHQHGRNEGERGGFARYQRAIGSSMLSSRLLLPIARIQKDPRKHLRWRCRPFPS